VGFTPILTFHSCSVSCRIVEIIEVKDKNVSHISSGDRAKVKFVPLRPLCIEANDELGRFSMRDGYTIGFGAVKQITKRETKAPTIQQLVTPPNNYNENTLLLRLPSEILVQILDNLQVLYIFSILCRETYYFANSDEVWKQVVKTNFINIPQEKELNIEQLQQYPLCELIPDCPVTCSPWQIKAFIMKRLWDRSQSKHVSNRLVAALQNQNVSMVKKYVAMGAYIPEIQRPLLEHLLKVKCSPEIIRVLNSCRCKIVQETLAKIGKLAPKEVVCHYSYYRRFFKPPVSHKKLERDVWGLLTSTNGKQVK